MSLLVVLAADLSTLRTDSPAAFTLTLLVVWAFAAAVVGFDWLMRHSGP
jgi:hypothetical protein